MSHSLLLNEPSPARVDAAPDATSPYERFRATRHFGSLDGIRGLCILAVIFHHSPGFDHLPHVFRMGFLGVDGFFALSGLLIETLLLRERSRLGSFSLPNFYIRRTLRIFPIYYLVLAGLLAGLGTLQPGSEAFREYLHDLPYFLTYTSNWMQAQTPNMGILWSLATEEQFYLIWPFVERFAPRRASLVVLILLLAGNQAMNFGALDGWATRVYSPGAWPAIVYVTFTPMLLGVALGRLLHDPRSFAVLHRLIGGRATPFVLGGLLLGALVTAPPNIQGVPRLLIQSLLALGIASVMIREDQRAAPLLRFAPLRRLGMVSYGAYLYHMFVLHVAMKVADRLGGINPRFYFPLIVLGTYAVAEVSYSVLEAPLLRLKERLTRGRGGVAAQT